MTARRTRGGRPPEPRMDSPETYPHRFASLIVVRNYLGVSQAKLDLWDENGDLRIYQFPAGVRKVCCEELGAFIRQHKSMRPGD